jgi:hypothetical protein
MSRRLTAGVLVALVCVHASASESAQLDSHTSSDALQSLQGDSKEFQENGKHSDAVASHAKDAGDEIKRKEAFLLDGLKGMRPEVKIDPMDKPTPEEKQRHEQAGQDLLRDPKAQCTPLIHYLHAQAAHDANMIFTDKALLAHVKFDMGDVWESKVEAILKAIQMNAEGVPQAVAPSRQQDLGEADEPLDPAADSDDESLDPQLTLDQAKIRADNDDTEAKALARMKSAEPPPAEEEEVAEVEQPAAQLEVEKLLLAEEDPEHAALRQRTNRASGDAEQWEFKAKANYQFMLKLAKAGSEEQDKYGAAQEAAREAAKATQAQTWREKQRLCDAVLPTIADQMNDGAKWLLSDFTLFSMAEKSLPAMDLAKLKSCVGALPEDQMVVPLGADASATAPPAINSGGAQWLRALASKRFAKELKGEMESVDDEDAASLASMLVKQGIRSISAMETAPADVWHDIKPNLRAKLRAVVTAQSAP